MVTTTDRILAAACSILPADIVDWPVDWIPSYVLVIIKETPDIVTIVYILPCISSDQSSNTMLSQHYTVGGHSHIMSYRYIEN